MSSKSKINEIYCEIVCYTSLDFNNSLDGIDKV